jgi:GNAT superfamily N-acetyltransferase
VTTPAVKRWAGTQAKESSADKAVSKDMRHVFGKGAPRAEDLRRSLIAGGAASRVKSTYASQSGDRNSVTVFADLRDADGKLVADMTRTLIREPNGEVTAKHETFFVEKQHQRKGIAKEVLRNTVAFYDKNNVTKIRLDASQGGRYAWARLGFGWADSTAARSNVQAAYETYLVVMKNIPREVAKRRAAAETMQPSILAGSPDGKAFLQSPECPNWFAEVKTSDPRFRKLIGL